MHGVRTAGIKQHARNHVRLVWPLDLSVTYRYINTGLSGSSQKEDGHSLHLSRVLKQHYEKQWVS